MHKEQKMSNGVHKTSKILILAVAILLFIGPIFSVQAQERPEAEELIHPEEGAKDVIIAPGPGGEIENMEVYEYIEDVIMDEDISAEDLNVGKPRLLPDSRFYFLKDWGRNIRTFFTFDPIKKAERRLQFANERLIEAKVLSEKEGKEEVITKTLEKYAKDMEKIGRHIEKFKIRDGEKLEDQPKLDKFLDKFTDHGFKQQKLIEKLDKALPVEKFKKVKEVKEKSLEQFGKVLHHLEEAEKIPERITKVLEEQEGSKFKHFQNLEILKELEEKIPEEAREAIRRAGENAMKRLQGDLEQMSPEDREKFKDYVENIGGDKIRHLEIVHELEAEAIPDEVREEIEKAKEKAFEGIEEKMKEFKDEEQKREFFKHLEQGKMEDIRIIKELEANLDPETIDRIIEIKNKALEGFKDEFEANDSPELRQEFLEKMEKSHDVKQMEILKEIEKVIPSDKKDFWDEMKEKVVTEMEKEIDEARNLEEREMLYKKFAGDAPEHIVIIKEFAPSVKITNKIIKEQVIKLENKIRTIKDAGEIRIFKEKIEENETIKQEVLQHRPQIMSRIEETEEVFLKEIDVEKAKRQIEEAAKALKAAEELPEEEISAPLLDNAREHLESARKALEEEKYGEAFGQATAALHNANNARRKNEEVKFQFRIKEERIEKIKERVPEIEFPEGIDCPTFTPPLEDFCKNGKIIWNKDKKGCPLPPKCIRFEEKTLSPEGTEVMEKFLEERGMEMTPEGIERVKEIIESGEGRVIKPGEMERIIEEATPEIRRIEPIEPRKIEGRIEERIIKPEEYKAPSIDSREGGPAPKEEQELPVEKLESGSLGIIPLSINSFLEKMTGL